MALSSSSSADSNTILTENDIPGASLNGRNPSSLKNEELKLMKILLTALNLPQESNQILNAGKMSTNIDSQLQDFS